VASWKLTTDAARAGTYEYEKLGDGCCEGERDESNGKLYGGEEPNREACQLKCLEFDSCGVIEYGWEDSPQWCFVWDKSQKCKKLDADCKLSTVGNGKGVSSWKLTTKTTTDGLVQYEKLGDGCCEGERDEDNGKLYGGEEPNGEACKLKCLTFDGCGIVEYGWEDSPQQCFIWNKTKQKCKKLDADCKKSTVGNGKGVASWKLTTDAARAGTYEYEKLGDGCCEGERDESNGKLYGGEEPNREACQLKCLEFDSCGVIEYGWEDSPQWCFVWDKSQKCKKLDADCKLSTVGNGKGVSSWKLATKTKSTSTTTTTTTTTVTFTTVTTTTTLPAEEDWKMIGPGCCEGERGQHTGELYHHSAPNLDACKSICQSFNNCGLIEYGWEHGKEKDLCYVWADSQTCKKQDLDCKHSINAHGKGVSVHKFSPPKRKALKLSDEEKEGWSEFGEGCCDGPRLEAHGKLFGHKEPTLESCQARCIEFEKKHGVECGIVEYGWENGDPEWCFIWDSSQKCEKMDPQCSLSAHGISTGVKAYRWSPVKKK